MTRICIIYPNDPTTDFLKKIPEKLSQELGEKVSILELTSDKEDLLRAKQYIENSSPNTFYIFLGHGTHLSLAGASLSGTNPYFIVNDNLSIFREKRLFSVSCKSSEGSVI